MPGAAERPLPQSASQGTFSAIGTLPTLPLLPSRSSTPQELVQCLACSLRRQTIDTQISATLPAGWAPWAGNLTSLVSVVK